MRRVEIVKSVSIAKRKSVVMASCARDIFAPRRFVVFTSSFAHVFLTLKRLTMLLSFLCPLSDSGADTIRLYLLRRKVLNERTNQNLILKSLHMFAHNFLLLCFLDTPRNYVCGSAGLSSLYRYGNNISRNVKLSPRADF